MSLVPLLVCNLHSLTFRYFVFYWVALKKLKTLKNDNWRGKLCTFFARKMLWLISKKMYVVKLLIDNRHFIMSVGTIEILRISDNFSLLLHLFAILGKKYFWNQIRLLQWFIILASKRKLKVALSQKTFHFDSNLKKRCQLTILSIFSLGGKFSG